MPWFICGMHCIFMYGLKMIKNKNLEPKFEVFIVST